MSICNVFRVYLDQNCQDPLNRFNVCKHPFNCGRRVPTNQGLTTSAEPTSLHMAAVYCILRQHELQPDVSLPCGQVPLSVQFLEDKKVQETPFGSITPWLQRHNLEFSPEITGNMYRIYLAVVINQVRQEIRYSTGNEMAKALLRIVRGSTTIPTFLAIGTDKVWAVGTAAEVMPEDDYPGGNALGQVFSKAARLMVEEDLASFDGLTTDHLLYLSTYKYPFSGGQSVLILSDSDCRLIDFIQQGRVFRRGGRTMGEVAEEAQKDGVDLSGYRWVIITGFTNDARKPKEIWERSFERLQAFIGPEIERRRQRARSTILYSLELPLVNIQNSTEHLVWIREKLECYDVSVQNWSDSCMFVDRQGRRVDKFFDDSIHLNQLGMHRQWLNWSEYLGSELQMFKIRFDNKYAAERGEGGTRGDRLRRMSPTTAKGIRDRRNKAQKRRKLRKLLDQQKAGEAETDSGNEGSARDEPTTSTFAKPSSHIRITDNTGKRRCVYPDQGSERVPIEVIDAFGNRRIVNGVGSTIWRPQH